MTYFDEDALYEARQTAYDWHGGQWSPLYSFASSGTITSKGSLLGEIDSCIASATMRPEHFDSNELIKLQELRAFVESSPETDEDSDESAPSKSVTGSLHDAEVSVPVVSKALTILSDEVLPALQTNPTFSKYMPRLTTLKNRLALALSVVSENEDVFTPEEQRSFEPLVEAVLILRQALRAKQKPTSPMVEDVIHGFHDVYVAAVRRLQASLPTPERFRTASKKVSMNQEDFIQDTPKILGTPGKDPDTTNFFDDRELFRKFYSQFYEGAVLIADDGTYYQVLELVTTSGNFVAMMQDVLHPQIVFTISVNDLVAHTWKWVSPFDVVVNPDLAPSQVSSIADLVSVGDLEKPEIPERWLSY